MSLGEQLRLEREARGISLREICDQTRISIHYLQAIEANDYASLPGGVFNRSFIKAYARCVGYDQAEAVEMYMSYLREHEGRVAAGATNIRIPKSHTPNPPANVEFVLCLFLRNDERDGVLGDLIERYRNMHERLGKRRADLYAYAEVLRSVYPLLKRALVKTGVMVLLGEWIKKLSS